VLPPRTAAAAEAAYAYALAGRPAADDASDGQGDDEDDGDDAGLVIAAADLDVLSPSAVRVIVTNAGVFAPAQAGRVLEELYGGAA